MFSSKIFTGLARRGHILEKSRPFRFMIAGAVNTAFGFGTYAVAIYLGAAVWLALLAGIMAGVVFNFISLGGYVFRDLILARFPRFVAVYLLIYVLNYCAISILRTWIPSAVIAQLILTIPMAGLSYFMMSRFVFR